MSETSSLYEDDVMLMQAAFRGHLSRRDLLDRKSQFVHEESDEDHMNYPPRFRRYVLKIIIVLQLVIGKGNVTLENLSRINS